jgi:hypothetical protein
MENLTFDEPSEFLHQYNSPKKLLKLVGTALLVSLSGLGILGKNSRSL